MIVAHRLLSNLTDICGSPPFAGRQGRLVSSSSSDSSCPIFSLRKRKAASGLFRRTHKTYNYMPAVTQHAQLVTPPEPIQAEYVLMLIPRDEQMLVLRPLLLQQSAEGPIARPRETRRRGGTQCTSWTRSCTARCFCRRWCHVPLLPAQAQ
jgi:hypothetical protein